MKRIIVNINTTDHHYRFIGDIHIATKDEELNLDLQLFYMTYRSEGDLISFPHHEIEIITDCSGFEHSSKLHIHKSEKTNKPFVCWTSDIKTIADAEKVFRLWCVGTVYTLITGNDFATIFYEAKTQDNYFKKMAEEYKIVFSKKGLTKGRQKI